MKNNSIDIIKKEEEKIEKEVSRLKDELEKEKKERIEDYKKKKEKIVASYREKRKRLPLELKKDFVDIKKDTETKYSSKEKEIDKIASENFKKLEEEVLRKI